MKHRGKQDLTICRLDYIVSVAVVALGVLSPSNARSQPSGAWSAQFGDGMGLSGAAFALITDNDGNLYAGGSFENAGGVPAQHIAMWDGSEWRALGAGLNDWVDALAIGPNGNLYAGGSFTKSGETPMEYAARWDGNEWHAITSEVLEERGPGSGPSIKALEFDLATGTLYVGGSFTSIDGVEASGIATWDGESWASVGAGFQGAGCFDSSLANVHDIEIVSSDDIYVAGNMLESDGVSLRGVAHWNGSTWEALGEGMDSPCELVSSVMKVGSDIFVAGTFEAMGGVAAEGVSRWNGSTWEALQGSDGTLPSGNASSLALLGSDLYVGGTNLTLGDQGRVGVAMWSGSDWFKLGAGLNELPVVHTLRSFQNQLWVSGQNVSSAGGHPSIGIALWEAAVSDGKESHEVPGDAALEIAELYPNPARGTISVTLNGAQQRSGRAIFQVYDVLGRLVDEVQFTILNLDEPTLQWQPRGLHTGQYFVKLRVGEDVATRRFLHVR